MCFGRIDERVIPLIIQKSEGAEVVIINDVNPDINNIAYLIITIPLTEETRRKR